MTKNKPKYPKGSEWRKWDLHLHTPSSFDYADKAVTNELLIEKLKETGIAAVVVTDHHVIDIDRIKKLQTLAGDDLAIFPGIEFTSDQGWADPVHFVGIFPDDCDLDNVWAHINVKTELDKRMKAPAETVYVNFKATTKLIQELGGIVSVHAGSKENSIEEIPNKAGKFAQAIKTDLVKNVDIFEINNLRDEQAYKTIVFQHIGPHPIVIGSDNHDIKSYELETTCWIKGDPTFAGLRQVLNEPEERIFLGATPPLLEKLSTNKTKYIRTILINKLDDGWTEEKWFSDCVVPINPGLVAIIGNKGGGKSALADTIGLLGQSPHSECFSFLNDTKFKQPRKNKAKHYVAEIEWETLKREAKELSAEIPDDALESIKYLPQGYIENMCNQLSETGESRFDRYFNDVIISHLKATDRLGKGSLDDLISYQTTEKREAITIIKERLHEQNREIVAFEEQLSASYSKSLNDKLEKITEELDAHKASKPEEIKKPGEGQSPEGEMVTIAEELKSLKRDFSRLQDQISSSEARKLILAKQIAASDKLLELIKNLKRAFAEYERKWLNEREPLSIDFSQIVTLDIQTDILDSPKRTAEDELLTIDASLNAELEGSLTFKLAKKQEEAKQLEERLDEPNRKYQAYLELLETWETKRTELIGDGEIIGSIVYLKNQVKNIQSLPGRLELAEQERTETVKEIHAALLALSMVYSKIYQPVQSFIEKHPDANEKFQLSFEARLTDKDFEENFFHLINQQRRGSFYGSEEGRRRLREILKKHDFETSDGIIIFLDEIIQTLQTDMRCEPPDEMLVDDQIKNKVTKLDLYDFLFSLDYINPKYDLKWFGKSLSQLSPGERGTLLLVFYLLIDTADIPLVMDQPEENLDNQTVFELLRPAIKEARKRRQVILVTHNPNLAVACDADQIICASIDKDDDNRVEYLTGSIESPAINKRVLDILEGTRPAFDNRDSKYNNSESV